MVYKFHCNKEVYGKWNRSIYTFNINFCIFVFLNKTTAKKVKEHKAMVENLKKGDKIVTSGGITGIITRVVDNDKVEVEIADNVTVEVIRGTGIQSLMNSQEIKK